jgi:hypothetical protein
MPEDPATVHDISCPFPACLEPLTSSPLGEQQAGACQPRPLGNAHGEAWQAADHNHIV